MDFLLVGLNHRTAPLEVRERVSFPKETLAEALPWLRDHLDGGVILSTCNRTEIYCTATDTPSASDRIRGFVCEFHGLAEDELGQYLYVRTGADAVRHLFRVAGGLDSLIVGESQILGQVRDALTAASDAQSAQVSLVGLFHAAVRAGRKVREETDVGRNAISISYAGVQLAQRTVGPLADRRTLLVGAGEAGTLVARALRTVGVHDLLIANRTRSHSDELAESLGGTSIPFGDLGFALNEADIVIAATDAPGFVVTEDMVSAALEEREDTLFLFDLAVPRGVDPGVASLDGVRLFNIDDLSAIAEDNLGQRRLAARSADAIVEDEVARLMTWWESLDAVPVIKTLQKQAEDIRAKELVRALRMMPDLPQEHRQIVEALTRSIVKKMLHEPTVFLRQRADKAHLEAARDLFRLWDES